jgi:phosphoserine phosphatase RsbU/P
LLGRLRFAYLVMMVHAALAQLSAADVRYHFGDDPRWADPQFDDANWPPGKNGAWRIPPPDSSGLMWVRFRVPVPDNRAGPLAISSNAVLSAALPDRIWVNGCAVGGHGSFPPQAFIRIYPATTVFHVPESCVAAGGTAVVALRAWYPPYRRVSSTRAGSAFKIDAERFLRLQEKSTIAESQLSLSFQTAESISFAIAGLGLLVIWRFGKGSWELFWFSVFLMGQGTGDFTYEAGVLFRPNLSWEYFWLIITFLAAASGAFLLEFQWAAYRIGQRGPLRLIQASVGVSGILFALRNFPWAPVAWVSFTATAWEFVYAGTSLATVAVSAWQFRRSPETRGVSAALIFWTVATIAARGALGAALTPKVFRWGQVHISVEDIADILFVAAVGFLLLRRMWRDWRRAQELGVEFEAASQMQRLLVPPGVSVPGFAVASVYLPAQQVGGDFFWTVPSPDGSLLLVAGDVSGKGLKAAMTVAALAGALRNETSRQPAQVLAKLNSVLIGQHGGSGFTTCCALLFDANGRLTIANAGHLPPYRNGEEVRVESGLPLGLIAEQEYDEVVILLSSGDNVTLVSDGVVEARNFNRELYGFERMRALSLQTAEEIAETARAFGQEDDISVITIRREAAVDQTA